MPFDLLTAVLDWKAQDPDAVTVAELDGLLDEARRGSTAAVRDLGDRFAGRLEFGTAGLRGAIGAGPARMNRVLVTQAAAGLAAFLRSREEHPSIVIGYDGRTNSRVFATDTAEIMAGVGVRAILLPRLMPTPVLAFAVRTLDTSAGVMVTASHNPAADNGYKVYLGGEDDGSQIVPPRDGEIADQILRVARGDIRELPRSTGYETASEDVWRAYIRQTAAFAGAPTGDPVRFVYTAMHGVGWETAGHTFAAAGFAVPQVVVEQNEPDAAFPTVAFPNPEEPGALDLAFALAEEVDAELVIANDPDADRLAVGAPSRRRDGTVQWQRLSGNEIGWLLGWRAAERLAAADADGTLACSIVSSPALKAIADAYHLDHVETLTGFKWISRAPALAYGFEEALGYLVDPHIVRDKDGISAAVDLLALATELKANGKTLADHSLDFAAKFGAFASSQISVRVTDLSRISQVMARLRAHPPASIGATGVDHVDDFSDGFGAFPAGDILRFWTVDGSRVIVRPSGTEPKLKVYIDSSSDEGTPVERVAAAQAKVAELDAGMRGLVS